jgi:hypothetical protein
VPDPFPVIELAKEQNNEFTYKQLQIENKDLKETLNAYNNEINLMNNKEVTLLLLLL